MQDFESYVAAVGAVNVLYLDCGDYLKVRVIKLKSAARRPLLKDG